MIEKKFKVPKEFQPEKHIDDIRVKIREISGIEVIATTLKPQVPGYNGTTYVINGDGLRVSIRYEPDAVNVDREGLGIYVNAANEEQIYIILADIFGLRA